MMLLALILPAGALEQVFASMEAEPLHQAAQITAQPAPQAKAAKKQPTKEEIAAQWATVTSSSTTYAEVPSVTAPYAAGSLTDAFLETAAEFAAYGGKFYRGGQFSDFAKKHLGVDEFGKECAKHLTVYSTLKCAHRFELYVNFTDETFALRRPFLSCGRAYILDAVSGDKRELYCRVPAEEYEAVRLLPGECAVLAWDTDVLPSLEVKKELVLREVHALKRGENQLYFSFTDGDRAVLEIDGIAGKSLDVSVNGTDLVRMLVKPYMAELTDTLVDGENVVSLNSPGTVNGAVLRLYRVAD
jgi:hypothetical protein